MLCHLDRHDAFAREDLAQIAGAIGRTVHHDQDDGIKIGKRCKQRSQRLDPATRGADRDDVTVQDVGMEVHGRTSR
jgi:hypothetical protein